MKLHSNSKAKEEQKLPETEKEGFDVDKEKVSKILEAAKVKGNYTLGLESFEILKAYGIPTVGTASTETLKETVEAAEEIGYPLVMKIISPQISHKSDVGGIKLGLKNTDEVKTTYREMMQKIPKKRPDAILEGVQLQQMLAAGNEVIIGMVRDPTFGPMLMFGLGGVYVEILKDVSFAITPVSEAEARDMIREIKTYPLLAGARGARPADIDALVSSIVRVSRLVCDFPEISEFEINPMMVFEEGKGAFAVDMRLILRKE